MTDYVNYCLEHGARIASTLERNMIGVYICSDCQNEIIDHFDASYETAFCYCGKEMTGILTFEPMTRLYL